MPQKHPKRAVKQRTVAQALHNRRWVSDIKGALTVEVLVEYLQIWDLVDDFNLHPDIPNHHQWWLTGSGSYSSKSAYGPFFTGTIIFAPWKWVWKSWGPLRCKFFIWLAIKGRCWTADRLAKRGLPHPSVYPLCDQADETIQHTLVACVFARQVWTAIFHVLGLLPLAPKLVDSRFSSWWCKTIKDVPKEIRKGLNSLIILVAWELWKHRNACVFEGASPCVQRVLAVVTEECMLWCWAGAKAPQQLLSRLLPVAV